MEHLTSYYEGGAGAERGRFAEAIGPIYVATSSLRRGYERGSFFERTLQDSQARISEWHQRSRRRDIKDGDENVRYRRKKIVFAEGQVRTRDRNKDWSINYAVEVLIVRGKRLPPVVEKMK